MRYARREAKAWARESLRDYVVTLTTPLHPDLSLDLDGLRRNVEYLLGFPRNRGIYVGSIYQEFWTLTLDERKRLAGAAIAAVAGRVPVVVGVSGNCAADVIDLARDAQDRGADIVMIWPPTFGQRSAPGVLDFYRGVISQLEVGVCVYASALSEIGFRLTPEMLEDLSNLENVCVVKEASMSIGTYLRTLRLLGDRIVVSCPLEEYWFTGRTLLGDRYAAPVLMGSSRPLYLNTAPRRLLEQFLDAADAGDVPAASAHLDAVLALAERLHNRYLQRGEHNVALTKAITGMIGMAAGPVRPPITMPSADELADARRALSEAALLPELVTA